MALCETDSTCKSRFRSNTLSKTLGGLIEEFDSNPNSTCAEMIYRTSNPSGSSPSFALRTALGAALMDPSIRTLIPPVVYRLQRCSAEDVDVLKQFFTSINSNGQTQSQDSALESMLLNNLIVYSEMTERPLPSMVELKARFINAKMSSKGGVYSTPPQYCAFTKEKSALCDELNVGNYDGSGIIYKRDQYWNKTASIPRDGSVLMLSGRLDAQTPDKYAKQLLKALDGEEKEVVTFEYATHEGDAASDECGMKLIVSYLRNGGKLKKMDRSCLDDMPAFNLTASDENLSSFFGTDDAYDGAFNVSLVPSS